jgi:hypothetical protein
LSVGELLDRTFFFYRQHFLLFVAIAALPSLVMLAFSLLTTAMSPASGSVLLVLVSSLVTVFLYLITTALSQGATVAAVSQILLGRETTVAECFSAIRSRFAELVILILNMGVRIVIGFLFFVVPGILLALMYALTMPVAVLEGKGISESLSRSSQLTKGHRGRIFLIYFLLTVLVTIVTMLWSVPATVAVGLVYGPIRSEQIPIWVQAAFQLGNFLTRSLLSPILTIAVALVYYDVRVRKEAFDLEHMLKQLTTSGLTPLPTA